MHSVDLQEGRVFPLNPTLRQPMLVRGEGIYVYDDSGKRYLDAIAGIAVVNVGHGRQRIAQALARQAQTLAFCVSNIFANDQAQRLAGKLAALTPKSLNHFQFTSGGSEAVEVAIKLARQYQLLRGREDRHLVVGRWNSYHGATLGALSVTGHIGRRRKFEPLLLDFPHIEPNYCYRCPFSKTYPACEMACAWDLERILKDVGPDRVAAFVAEPIVGAANAATVPPPEYFPIIREICDRHDILFVADEVITGLGRTGRNFGIEHWGVMPDMIVMAKGLSSGYAPLGAVAIAGHVWQAFSESGTPFDHIFTYAANPLSAAAACEALDIMVEERLVERAARVGAYLFSQSGRLQKHGIVGDVRGRGLLMGVELVRDQTTREPFPAEWKVHARVAAHALQRGLVIYPGGGSADGVRGDHFLICPPLIVQESDIDRILELLEEALLATAADLAREHGQISGTSGEA